MWIFIIIIAVIIAYFLITYNSLVKAKTVVEEAFSTMDIYLKKRWDLIPNLVEIVKGYAKHESNTLEEIVKLRNNNYDQMNNNEKVEINDKLTKQISNLMAIVENYPELRASENFQNLSNQILKIEDEIANSRKYYNGSVRLLNNKILMFPSNIVAKMLGYKEEKMFEISSKEREDVKVEF